MKLQDEKQARILADALEKYSSQQTTSKLSYSAKPATRTSSQQALWARDKNGNAVRVQQKPAYSKSFLLHHYGYIPKQYSSNLVD